MLGAVTRDSRVSLKMLIRDPPIEGYTYIRSGTRRLNRFGPHEHHDTPNSGTTDLGTNAFIARLRIYGCLRERRGDDGSYSN